jgi:broad specificity phosphatase PhoE
VSTEAKSKPHLHLHVLRHAQASANSPDYDELSLIGHSQAKRFGEWLVAHEVRFDAIYLGSLKRHAQTLAGIGAAYAAAKRALPISCVLPELNEYDFRGVLNAYRSANPHDPDAAAGRWLVVLKTAMLAWARAQISAPELETWVDFQIRVAKAAKQIGRDAGEVLVVTSGGVISLLAQRALGFEDESVAALNLAIKNTALNEFRVTRNGWQLQSFNAMPHLSAPADLALHTRV